MSPSCTHVLAECWDHTAGADAERSSSGGCAWTRQGRAQSRANASAPSSGLREAPAHCDPVNVPLLQRGEGGEDPGSFLKRRSGEGAPAQKRGSQPTVGQELNAPDMGWNKAKPDLRIRSVHRGSLPVTQGLNLSVPRTDAAS